MTTLLALFMIQSSRISPVLTKTHTKMNIALAKNNKYFFFPCRGLTSTGIVRRNLNLNANVPQVVHSVTKYFNDFICIF